MWKNGWELKIRELRDKIDEIDRDIISRMAQRMRLCEKIGEIKAEYELPVYAPGREREVFEKRVVWSSKYALNPEFILNLFVVIVDESKRRQGELVS